ncbi:hypothetical protein SCACP_27680 [Sporomusa carbonis]|uniref:CLC_0170 family protein n=1 Tax=Sporomusa carbonis TaxID=3076075 RepID=UPI003A77C37B
MSDTSIIQLITGPLKPSFAVFLIFVGLYSIIVNAKHENKQNRIRSAKFARLAGWCYVIGGAGLLAILWL